MKSINELGRINKIEGNVFISFDLNELDACDDIACGALKLDQPQYILYPLLDGNTNIVTMRYAVPEGFVDIASNNSELQISEILALYEKILEMLDTCEDWYLKPGGLCFELSYVYMSTNHEELKVLYVPEQEVTLDMQDVKHLMISLLEKCQETSGGNIQLQLYKYFYKPKFEVKEFKEMLLNFKQTLKKDDSVVELTKSAEPEVTTIKVEVPVVDVEVPEPEPTPVVESLETFSEKTVAEVTEPIIEEKVEETSSRGYYSPKIYPSQLSQEEVEEMVKSIYSGNSSENVVDVTSKAVEESNSYSEKSGSNYTAEEKNNSLTKRRLDGVFGGNKSQSGRQQNNGSGHVASLKSISIHTRYDLPKLIEVRLVNQQFTIGRATRTGELTGADYEFGAEITPISRLHAQIEMRDGMYYIKDLESSNGTFLNGKKLEPHKPYLIEEGDKIAFAIAYSKSSIEYAFVE